MIRKRFSSWRVAKVASLTLAALTWSAAGLARLTGLPGAEGSEPPPPLPPAAPSAPSQTVTVVDSMPELPAGGLYVIRSNKQPEPQPIVRRVVVQQASPAPQPPAKRTQSSGS